MRTSSFDVGWQRMFNPKGYLSFLVAMLGIGFLHDSAYSILHASFAGDWDAVKSDRASWIMLALGAMMLGIGAFILRKRFTNLKDAPSRATTQSPAPKKGLVVLVSNEAASRAAIDFHQETLEFVWFLHTDQSKEIVDNLVSELHDGCKHQLIPIHSFENPIEYHDKIQSIYRHLPPGLHTDDVILDFTGLSKPGSVGSVLAGLEVDAPLQYTPQVSPKVSGMPLQIVIKESLKERKDPSAEGN